MSTLASTSALYKGYTSEDKAALRELRAEVSAKIGSEVSLGDMIAAVEPPRETPKSLRKV